MRKTLPVVGILLLVVLCVSSGCAAGPNIFKDSPGADGSVAGFWLGLWHGVILPFAFLISLFSDKVTIYEVHNTGGWYNFGFLFGALCWAGGRASARQ